RKAWPPRSGEADHKKCREQCLTSLATARRVAAKKGEQQKRRPASHLARTPLSKSRTSGSAVFFVEHRALITLCGYQCSACAKFVGACRDAGCSPQGKRFAGGRCTVSRLSALIRCMA